MAKKEKDSKAKYKKLQRALERERDQYRRAARTLSNVARGEVRLSPGKLNKTLRTLGKAMSDYRTTQEELKKEARKLGIPYEPVPLEKD